MLKKMKRKLLAEGGKVGVNEEYDDGGAFEENAKIDAEK
jgi:hypothetical protein